jgi:hypothetical protein
MVVMVETCFHACPLLLEQGLFGDVGGLVAKVSHFVRGEVSDLHLARRSQRRCGPHYSPLGNDFVLLGWLGSSVVRGCPLLAPLLRVVLLVCGVI